MHPHVWDVVVNFIGVESIAGGFAESIVVLFRVFVVRDLKITCSTKMRLQRKTNPLQSHFGATPVPCIVLNMVTPCFWVG